MYKEYLKLQSFKNRIGTFTTTIIPAKSPIIEFNGPTYFEKNLPNPNDPNILQVGPDTFLAQSGNISDYINHSCNPNCFIQAVGNRAILYSMYVIPPNTELTFDYSTTSTDTLDKWKMDCLCGENNCRKVISGIQYVDDKIKQQMVDKGMLPLYILEPNMFLKSW